MTREERLLLLIKKKYRSLHNFSIVSGIPNSTLNSMLKKGLGGTAVDTVARVCSVLGCDLTAVLEKEGRVVASAEDLAFFSDYLNLAPSSQELVRLVTDHQLSEQQEPSRADVGKEPVSFQNEALDSIETEDVSEKSGRQIPFPDPAAASSRIRIYLSAASAGTGEYLEDAAYRDITMTEEIPAQADFGVAIHGDSMMPRIQDGDVVWVQQQEVLDENQIGVFILNGDALCKKLVRNGRRIVLRSLNPAYRDIPLGEDDSFKVIGRVIDVTPFPSV